MDALSRTELECTSEALMSQIQFYYVSQLWVKPVRYEPL